MKSRYFNPVSYVLCFIFGGLLLMVVQGGNDAQEALQHLLIPYTVHLPPGLTESWNTVLRLVLLLCQAIMVVFIYLVAWAGTLRSRIVLSIFGIFFVLVYFLLVAGLYVSPRFH